MVESLVIAAQLPKTGPDRAEDIGAAEGQATVALLGRIRDADWSRPTDCAAWDVRALVSHLVAQSEDGIGIWTMTRREVQRRVRYRELSGVDGHMAVQIDDHRDETGTDLVEQFTTLWPRAVRSRRRKPSMLRAAPINPGVPGVKSWQLSYLLDTIYNRDLLMHRIDLSRAIGVDLVTVGHERQIVEQVVRDLALTWRTAPIALHLTGAAGGVWLLGTGEPAATIRVDAIAYMRTLSGRDDDPTLDLADGDPSTLDAARNARVAF